MRAWVIPTLLALFTWSLWAFLPKIATRYIDANSAMVYQALGAMLVGLGTLIVLRFKVQFNVPGFSLSVVIGVLGFVGVLLYLIALSRGPLTLVAPMSALYPLVAIILGFIFLQETVTPKQGVGIALSLAAILLIST